MSPEREIVNLWLNKRGYLTINGINAGSRVVDFVAVKHKPETRVLHVEVACSISANILFEKDRNELAKMFYDKNVVKLVEETINESIGKSHEYDNVLVTNFHNLNLDGISIVKFEDVLFDIMKDLDKQKYKSQTIRTLQLLKFLLMSDPARLTELISTDSSYKAMTTASKEAMIRELLSQEHAKKVLGKASNEQLLVELLRYSTLKNPEKMAVLLEDVLTKRSGSRLLNLLMQKKGVQTAIKEELEKDRKLEQFLK